MATLNCELTFSSVLHVVQPIAQAILEVIKLVMVRVWNAACHYHRSLSSCVHRWLWPYRSVNAIVFNAETSLSRVSAEISRLSLSLS